LPRPCCAGGVPVSLGASSTSMTYCLCVREDGWPWFSLGVCLGLHFWTPTALTVWNVCHPCSRRNPISSSKTFRGWLLSIYNSGRQKSWTYISIAAVTTLVSATRIWDGNYPVAVEAYPISGGPPECSGYTTEGEIWCGGISRIKAFSLPHYILKQTTLLFSAQLLRWQCGSVATPWWNIIKRLLLEQRTTNSPARFLVYSRPRQWLAVWQCGARGHDRLPAARCDGGGLPETHSSVPAAHILQLSSTDSQLEQPLSMQLASYPPTGRRAGEAGPLSLLNFSFPTVVPFALHDLLVLRIEKISSVKF
jgi:hypothetical protein